MQIGCIDNFISDFDDVNNDSFILGEEAATYMATQPAESGQKICQIGTGYGKSKKVKGGETKQNKFEKFKQNIVKTEEKQQKWEETVKKQLEREIQKPRENARYCVHQPPQINKKGVEVSNNFGGKVRENVNSVVENVLDKVKSAAKIEWLTENEFRLIKGWQTNDREQPATAPGWELREGEFPQLNSLSEHTSGEKNRHSIKTKFAITGKPHRGKGRSALRAAMAKQAAVLMMVAVLATSQAEPATVPTPSVTSVGPTITAFSVGPTITAFDCQHPTQMKTESAVERGQLDQRRWSPLRRHAWEPPVVTFQCTPVNVRLRVATTGHEDMSVNQRPEGEQQLVDVHRRRLKSHAAVTPCRRLWPRSVNGDHRWWQLPEPPPAEAPTVAARGEAAQGTLYTAKQFEGWRRPVTVPKERETVPSAPAARLRGRSNDRAAGMATGPTQGSGEVAANAPPAITADPKQQTE